jgi:hypothetical protein
LRPTKASVPDARSSCDTFDLARRKPKIAGLGCERAARRILEPKGDALTGCWLIGSGKAPEEPALIFGKTLE